MSKTVSVVVPVYNRSHILPECLENLVNQTLQNIEIILVNDASTDNTLSVIKQYEARYPEQIRAINSLQNMGPGGARNLGIESAAGEFIGFTDSDDIADTTMYEKLYQTALASGYDIIDCGYYCQEKDLAILHTPDSCTGVLNDEKRKELIVSGGYIFSKLYRKEIFENPNLRFRQNVILEDADFLTYLYATANSIGNLKEILYFYRNEPNSASKILDTNKYYHNIYEAILHIHRKTCSLANYHYIQPAIEYELVQMYSYGVNICLRAYKNHEQLDVIALLRQLAHLKSKVVENSYENPYVQNKITPLDIGIMQLNDLSPEELIKLI